MKKFIFVIYFCCVATGTAQACRFWVAVGKEVPAEFVFSQLLEMPHSLKFLGSEYADGWSIGIYKDGEEAVIRGSKASHIDGNFDQAVKDLGAVQSSIVMGHLRRASSGCVEDVPNPHPFKRWANGKEWLFGHNGGMKKQILIDLIGEEYLNQHQPTTCTYDAPDSWIDSELFFIFLLKKIEESNGEVVQGLQEGLTELYEEIDDPHRYLNFFLTNGEEVWTFKKGNSLFYNYDAEKKVATVTSTVPEEDQSQWVEFPDDTIAALSPGNEIQFFSMYIP